MLAEDECKAVADAGSATVDLDAQTVTCDAGTYSFEIDQEIKHRLLNGLDDIGVTLQNEAAIDAFESAGKADRAPVTTAL